MISLCANLGFLWPDRPLLERIDAAARAGFRAVEFHWPYEIDACTLATHCERLGVAIRGINTPRGNASKGEFGLAALPGREREFRMQFDRTLSYALDCGAAAIHIMAGSVERNDISRAAMLGNLEYASRQAAGKPVLLLLEPLNPFDNPGYFYSRIGDAAELIDELRVDNIRLQFDAYHVARTEGDVIEVLRNHFPLVGHVQIAGVPTRQEPDESIFDYREFFAELNRLKYSAFVGCEYKPRGDTDVGLRWRESVLS